MQDFSAQAIFGIDRQVNLDTVVHLGAGLCRELETYRASGARSIYLVEPNPDLVPILQDSEREDDRVRVLALAIAQDSGTGALDLYNFPALASLRKPLPALGELFPGLKHLETRDVQTMAIAQLVDSLGISVGSANLLVIETPGEEISILQALIDADGLNRFDHVVLTAPVTPLYTNAAALEAVLDLLEEQDYRVIARDADDPDFPRVTLFCDHHARETRLLHGELASVREDLAAAEATKAETAEALRNAEARIKATQAEADSARKAAKAAEADAAAAKTEAAEARRKAGKNAEAAEAATAAAKAADDTILKHEADLKAGRMEARKLRQTVEEQRQQIETLEKGVAESEQRRLYAEAEIISAEAQLDMIRELMLPRHHKE